MRAVAVRIFTSSGLAASLLHNLLAAEKDVRVVSGEEPFEVGIFDGEMASLDHALTMARLRLPSMRAVLVSPPCDENECLLWVLRGICGWVSSEKCAADLAPAILHVAAGQLWLPRAVALRSLAMQQAADIAEGHEDLTAREREVLALAARRLSNKEIAAILKVSERTVKFHITNVFRKLDVHSRRDLATGVLRRPTESTS